MSLSRPRSNHRLPAAALVCVLLAGWATGSSGQNPPPIRRALPVTEPPVPRAQAVDQPPVNATPRPAPPPPNDADAGPTPAPPPPSGDEAQPSDRRQLDYANGLFGRKLYDLAIPEFEKYLADF